MTRRCCHCGLYENEVKKLYFSKGINWSMTASGSEFWTINWFLCDHCVKELRKEAILNEHKKVAIVSFPFIEDFPRPNCGGDICFKKDD